jgi:hypothetical protein
VHEAGPQEEILGRIARDRELGEDDEVGAGCPGLLNAAEDQIAITLEISHGRIDLRERELHGSFSLTVENHLAAGSRADKLACANLVSANFRTR